MALPMLSVAGSVLGAGLNIMGQAARNQAISEQAAENYNATQQVLKQTRDINFANLKFQGEELQRQVGMQLTQLGQEARKASSQMTARTAETNVYGITAQRLKSKVDMDAAIAEDGVIQQGESAMQTIQSKLASANYEYNSGIYQASMQYASSMHQMASSAEIMAGAASSAVSFASAGYNLSRAGG